MIPGSAASVRLVAALAAAVSLAAFGCGGGGGSPSSPSTPTTPIPSASACDVLGGRAGLTASIVNGTECSISASPVVLLNLRDAGDRALGSCSATVIAPRAVLTAAHCLDEQVAGVRVWGGSGDQVEAESFHIHPRYNGSADSSFDVGVVLTVADIPRPAVPVLLGRDATVGEQAIIAGWGQDGFGVSRVLRAGYTSITGVTAGLLEARYTPGGSNSGVCGGDSGGPIFLSQGGTWAVAGVTSSISNASCAAGSEYFANLRHPDNRAFVLGLVPGATLR